MNKQSSAVLDTFLENMSSSVRWSPSVSEMYLRPLLGLIPDSLVPVLITEMKRRHPKWRPSDSEVKLLAEELLRGAVPTPEQIVAEIRAKISLACSVRTYEPSWSRRKRPAPPALTFSHPLVEATVNAAGGWPNVLEIARTNYFDLRIRRCLALAAAGGVPASSSPSFLLASAQASPALMLEAA